LNTSALEYWITRWSLSSGSPKARPGGGWRQSHDARGLM